MQITFLYGTESGNAEMLCDDLIDEIKDDHTCEVFSLGDVAPDELENDAYYVFVSSTHGNGDLPAAAAEFVDALEAAKPDLSGITFSIFGLGDMVFAETFAQGSEKLMKALVAHGAKQVGERGIHDASEGEMPEDIAIPWMQDVLKTLLHPAN